jgi:hypothetical protein
MRYRKSITLLVSLIMILSAIATTYGIFSSEGDEKSKFQSIFGQTVTIYGKGLYRHDSVSIATQAVAQDYVTLFLGIPLLFLSLLMAKRELMKGKLLLTGTLGYFLYTYVSYTFLSMYNSFFLLYVLLMSASFFAFTLSMMSFDIPKIQANFDEKLPVKFIGGFLFVSAFIFGVMWLAKIIPALQKDVAPAGIEHYTTMVIQALDLGFVIPISILAGILLINRNAFGYLLASVMILKEITLLTSLSLMVILQMLTGIKGLSVMLVVVLLFNISIICCMYLIMKHIKEPTGHYEKLIGPGM